jgi:anti-sigma regulatory factor (Ser/Thr protein kinase)
MSTSSGTCPDVFRHEALLYSGVDDFVRRASDVVNDGVDADRAIVVAVTADKIEHLRSSLGSNAARVRFTDRTDLRANPARMIPVWQQILREGRRGIGVAEPIWPGRTDEEIVECHHHEALVNVAFAGGFGWDLVCAYDIESLPADVIDECRRHHPLIHEAGHTAVSESYVGIEACAAPFDAPLPDPPPARAELAIDHLPLGTIRAFAAEHAMRSHLDQRQTADFVVAVNELATNSLVHGGGSGVLRLWDDGRSLVCEVTDAGEVLDPLVGRHLPSAESEHGRGMWMVNQICDLVQVRNRPTGTAVRMHVHKGH